jgi:Na+-translocating ferredoxin:NAD+ oxidoreductase RNF subunit RnfB
VGDALPAKAVRRKAMLLPRLGLRLDNEMSKAMEKLAKIEETTRSLPGRDCGRCGAPTCAALAEDFVLGRASKATCVFVRERSEKKA